MSTTAVIPSFQQIAIPLAPVDNMGFIPSQACVTAAGGTAADVVQNPGAASWTAAAAAISGVGYIEFDQTDNGSDANGTRIRVLITSDA